MTLKATFDPPSVTEITDLVFEATINGTDCDTAPVVSDVTVQIQVVSDLAFDLGQDTLAINEVLNLSSKWTTGATGILEADKWSAQYAVESPPPDGLVYDLDQDAGTLQVTSGTVGTVLTITVEFFGTSGSLATASDTIELVAAP